MKKILVALLAVVLLLSVVGCNKTPPDVPDNTDKDKEIKNVEEQLLSYDSYDVFEDEIYLCDDVYRSDDTLTHGTGSISLPMGQDILKVEDYDILLCGDGCDPTAVVSRASQGYAPVYHVVPDGEIDGNFKVLKFKMEIPEPMLEDIQKQGVYEQIVEEIESQYYYLLVLDEKHYAYIHFERIEGAEKIESEAELADAIVKNARISFEPDNEKINLTIERVIRLAENKGEDLTWSDFEMYNGTDIGSGLYIMNYEINETFDLMVGGVPGTEPMYIRLVTKTDRDNYIDIRTEDVEKFISENREENSSSEMPDTNYSDITEIDSLPPDTEKAIFTGATVGGTARFYCYDPGMKYYRYDTTTEKYYEGVLNLSAFYTDGQIIHFRSGAGSGEIEIIVMALDQNGKMNYLGYNFAHPSNPLDREPSQVVHYSEQELIDSGLIQKAENEFDWGTINGEWYYGFVDENGYQFYRLAFDMKTGAMNFDYGFFESEYVNRYTGTFTIAPVSQEITAVLHDSSVMHTDPDITMKFHLASSENSGGAVLVWKVVSCDVEKYGHLVDMSVEFSKNMPSIIELSAVKDGDFKIYTIPQDGASSLVLKIPKAWYWESGYFVEDYDGSPAFPTVKRVAYRKATQTLQEFTDELRATEPGYTQYDMGSPLNGETDAGHAYVGYFGDGEQIKGLRHRRYLFYITADAGAYILEVCQYPDVDGAGFGDEILNTIIKSFNVNTNSSDVKRLSSDDAVELLKEQLIVAYENTYGEFVSSDEEPSIYVGDKERLSYIIPRLTVKEETDQYYIISVIWDFYVDKETHEIFKFYNGMDEMFIPFDPQADTALSFAG